MARSFVLWLHGLGDSGPANEPIKKHHSFLLLLTPSLVTANKISLLNLILSFAHLGFFVDGAVMPSWFGIAEIPVTATPILWPHGMAARTALFEAGQEGPPFLERAGLSGEFKAYPGLVHSISNKPCSEFFLNSLISSSSAEQLNCGIL